MRGLGPLYPSVGFADAFPLLAHAAEALYQSFRCLRALVGRDREIVFRECHLLALALALVGAVLLAAWLTGVFDPA